MRWTAEKIIKAREEFSEACEKIIKLSEQELREDLNCRFPAMKENMKKDSYQWLLYLTIRNVLFDTFPT